jgi:hypothetical protein
LILLVGHGFAVAFFSPVEFYRFPVGLGSVLWVLSLYLSVEVKHPFVAQTQKKKNTRNLLHFYLWQ